MMERKKRLTPEQVEDIRRRHSRFEASVRELASEYGVSKSLVGKIVKGEVYKGAVLNPAQDKA